MIRKDQLDEYFIDNLINSGMSPGFNVVVSKNNKIIYHISYGKSDSIDFSADTVFNVGSVTKPITGSLLVKLYEAGKLDVSDLVTKYIAEYSFKNVTLFHLLTHTGGFDPTIETNTIKWPESHIEFKDYINIIYTEHTQSYEPATKCLYYTQGYSILMDVIQRVADKSIDEYAREILFDPLEMDKSTYEIEKCSKNFVLPVSVYDGSFTVIESLRHIPPTGDSGLITNGYELIKFGNLFLNQGKANGVQIFKPETVKYMLTECSGRKFSHTPVFMTKATQQDYPGFFCKHNSIGAVGHPGFSGTMLFIDPVHNVTVAFITNSTKVGEEWYSGPDNLVSRVSNRIMEGILQIYP